MASEVTLAPFAAAAELEKRGWTWEVGTGWTKGDGGDGLFLIDALQRELGPEAKVLRAEKPDPVDDQEAEG